MTPTRARRRETQRAGCFRDYALMSEIEPRISQMDTVMRVVTALKWIITVDCACERTR